jgi:dsRNA-specific ribonuclease
LSDNEKANEELACDAVVPKILGGIFCSVAGAILIDSGMSLDTVWRSYYPLLHEEIGNCFCDSNTLCMLPCFKIPFRRIPSQHSRVTHSHALQELPRHRYHVMFNIQTKNNLIQLIQIYIANRSVDLPDGRVYVEVKIKGNSYVGVRRTYCAAKCAAAKRALGNLKI